MPYVNCPPGMAGLRMEDGKHYRAGREGGRMFVEDRHVPFIDAMPGNGTAGLVTARFREYGGKGKPGRRCTGCGRVYYPWTLTCPRAACGAATEPERPAGAR
jgi:hypothetical protein